MSSYTVIVRNHIDEALDYAKDNCPSYITNSVVIDPVTFAPLYKFYFYDEKDAMLFSLKWV